MSKSFGTIAKIAVAISVAVGLGQSVSAVAGGRDVYIPVGRQSLPPFGWVDFCQRYARECDARPAAALDVNWTPDAIKRIRRINSWVNTHVTPMSDMDHWGVVDRWDYPTDGYGDCEDFVLMKRRLLMEEGFPRQALLITVVKDERGDGHALLTVKSNKGEYVLDNLDEEVRLWSETTYHFIKRQSQTDQNVWLELGDPTSAPLMVSR